MEKCPVCSAKHAGRVQCHRCKTNFAELLKIEHQAEEYLDKACFALKKNNYDQMHYFTEKSLALKASEQGKNLLLFSSILTGKLQKQNKTGLFC